MSRAAIHSPLRENYMQMSAESPWARAARRYIFVALGTLGIVLAFCADAAAAPIKEWTVLIFMNGKNDLERFALDDFAELARVGSSNEVNFVVQLGRPETRPGRQAELNKLMGGWSGARRYLVNQGTTPSPGQELQNVGSGAAVDMGHPETLISFLKWGKAQFPARRFAVIIWNHGQGYRLDLPEGRAAPAAPPAISTRTSTLPFDVARTHRAVSQDADSGSIIYNADLRRALQSTFRSELRLVGFDACLMAMLETAYELRGLAPVMVASEELEPGEGWDYTSVARALVANPAGDELQLGKHLINSYRDSYKGTGATTLSAIKLDTIAPLAREISALSRAFLNERARLFPLIAEVRAERGSYNYPDNPVSIDLIGFLDSLEQKIVASAGSNASVLAHLRHARQLARTAVLANYTSEDRAEPYGSTGIAIYFPESKAVFDNDGWGTGYLRSNTFKQIDFVHNEDWSLFLQAYLGLGK